MSAVVNALSHVCARASLWGAVTGADKQTEITGRHPQNRSTGTLGAFAGLFIVDTEPQHHQGIAGHCEHLSGTVHYPA